MAPKGTQVATGSSTKLPGSSAPTERPAYPGRLPVSAAVQPGGEVRRAREYEKNRAAVAMYGGVPEENLPRLLSEQPGSTSNVQLSRALPCRRLAAQTMSRFLKENTFV